MPSLAPVMTMVCCSAMRAFSGWSWILRGCRDVWPDSSTMTSWDGGAVILPEVRDPRLVTIRRGGTLTDADHHLLALWAATCAEHVLGPLRGGAARGRPTPTGHRARPRLGARRGPDDGVASRRWPCHGCRATLAWSGTLRGVCRRAGRLRRSRSRARPGRSGLCDQGGGEAAPAAESRRTRCGVSASGSASSCPTVRDLVLEDQERRNAICWSVFVASMGRVAPSPVPRSST